MTVRFKQVLMSSLAVLLLNGCAAINQQVNFPPMKVVEDVEIEKYMGKWFEIASIPMSFQQDCTGTSATYTLNPDKTVKVFNQCFENSLDGPERNIEGKAWVDDKQLNSKLKVQFFWPFSGDYWLIELDKDYQYAVVGHPSRNYLWILSRKAKLDSDIYGQLLNNISSQGYDLNRVVKTLQREDS